MYLKDLKTGQSATVLKINKGTRPKDDYLK
jgi:hypothetical protein